MKARLFAVLLVTATPVLADAPFTAIHPEAAIPDPDSRVVSGPYSDLYIQVQERLNALGYHAGPPNGDFGAKTQAALAQFQLSIPLPASGQLDEATLAHLGVREYPMSADGAAGATRETAEPKPD